MKKVLICQHGGSGNHGCEALIRTALALIRAADPEAAVTLYSYRALEDKRYLADLEGLDIRGFVRPPGRYSPSNLAYHARRALGRPASKLPITPEFRALVAEADLVIAIGGDNYCYNQGRGYWPLDRYIKAQGKRYMLLGCSIEPDDLPLGLADHLRLFDRITVREGLSMAAMVAAGLRNIVYIPDSAFLLEPVPPTLPEGLEPGRAVGVNLSPLVMRSERTPGLTLRAFTHLVRHILDTTDMQVALIPHVVWPGGDDREALAALAQAVGDGGGRVFVLPDAPARALKGLIGGLRFFVGARTHATIAAYSSGVPTLVLGYSVKARGIARDLFGVERGFVTSVQNLSREDELTVAFSGIQAREEEILARLARVLPGYRDQAGRAADCIGLLLDESAQQPEHDTLALATDSVAGLIGRERCAGCGACAVVCPVSCIDSQTDGEGFVQPRVDPAACTGCGACRRVCPAARGAGETRPRTAFAAAASGREALAGASSGGVFGVLARQALARGAVVYGAAFDDNFALRHVRCEHPDALPPLIGSKYVQSQAGDAMADALIQLRQGREVLFCGVTCQANALALLTPKALRDRLTLVDVVCHGAPSPKVFEKYRAELEAAAQAGLTGLDFRDKSSGWQTYSVTARFAGGGAISGPAAQNPYMKLFLQNLSLRRACYTCVSKRAPLSDLTLADFWGIRHFAPGFDWRGGAGLVLTRTARGQALFEAAKDALRVAPVSADGLERYNPCIYQPVARPESREAFFDDLADGKLDLAELAKKYVKKPPVAVRLRTIIGGKRPSGRKK